MQWHIDYRGPRILRPIKNFEEFISEGVVKKQSPNKSRARYLIEESKKSYESIKEIKENIGITEKNANIIIRICYDSIMEMIRAEMLIQGFNSSGRGAHEAEVSFLKNLEFSENDIQFMDNLRFFRNGIIYYGKILDKEYASKVFYFLEKIYPVLLKKVDI